MAFSVGNLYVTTAKPSLESSWMPPLYRDARKLILAFFVQPHNEIWLPCRTIDFVFHSTQSCESTMLWLTVLVLPSVSSSVTLTAYLPALANLPAALRPFHVHS